MCPRIVKAQLLARLGLVIKCRAWDLSATQSTNWHCRWLRNLGQSWKQACLQPQTFGSISSGSYATIVPPSRFLLCNDSSVSE